MWRTEVALSTQSLNQIYRSEFVLLARKSQKNLKEASYKHNLAKTSGINCDKAHAQ
jgi:hypothetical protein